MRRIPMIVTLLSLAIILFSSLFIDFVPHNANHYPLVTELYDGSANIVSAIYLDFRLYDTLFEILIFSIAIMGVSTYSKRIIEAGHVTADASGLVRFDLFILGIGTIGWGLYTVMTGHLQPGGAFSGGAISSSGIVVLTLAFGAERIHRGVERFRLEFYENLVIFVVLAYIVFADPSGGFFSPGFPVGVPGDFFSGRGAILLNGAIGFKVFIGGWLIFHEFAKRKESV